MRKFTRKALIALALAWLMTLSGAALAVSGGAGSSLYTHTAQLTDDLAYTNTISQHDSAGRQESYLLSLAEDGGVYPVVLSCDTIYGGMTIGNLVDYAEQQGYNVLAAVNSDFFGGNSVPFGPVIEDGVYKSSPEGRSVVGFREDGVAFICESPQIVIELENEENGESFAVTHFNKNRYNGYGLYLYSSAFSTVSTRTSTDGWMVRLRILKGKLTVDGEMKLEVAELLRGSEAAPIGDDYLILTADATSNLDNVFRAFGRGDRVTLTVRCDNDDLRGAAWACGGGDILVEKGRLTDEARWDSLIGGRHPRTAAGIRADGSLVLYVADGRQSGHAAGLTLAELGRELLDQDCETAVNLDGGTSSAMALRLPGDDGTTVINSPVGGQHRCGTYILLVTDQRANGKAERLYLKEDGAFVLAGSTISLNCVAMDRAYRPAAAGPVEAESSGLGSVSGNAYVAGMKAGIDTLALSDNSARGSASLHIIKEISGLTVSRADGAALEKLRLHCGESAALEAGATYLGREVLASAGAFTYNVLGNVGNVSPEGVFIAGTVPGVKGSLVVSGYGLTKTVSVSVLADFQDIKGHWAENYINILAEAEVVSGISGIAYGPEQRIRRGDFILMLYRAAGEPELSSFNGFVDVDPDRYYADAVLWAAGQGIARGGADGRFRPEDPLSREEAMAFVWRALQALGRAGAEPTAEEAAVLLAQFPDSGEMAAYARIPGAALIRSGVIGGSNGRLSAASQLTRAEMAKILCTAWNYM